jgi:hypothetical protein
MIWLPSEKADIKALWAERSAMKDGFSAVPVELANFSGAIGPTELRNRRILRHHGRVFGPFLGWDKIWKRSPSDAAYMLLPSLPILGLSGSGLRARCRPFLEASLLEACGYQILRCSGKFSA